jgi:hypothetical protein
MLLQTFDDVITVTPFNVNITGHTQKNGAVAI